MIHTGGGSDRPERNWLMHLMATDPEDSRVLSLSKGRRLAP